MPTDEFGRHVPSSLTPTPTTTASGFTTTPSSNNGGGSSFSNLAGNTSYLSASDIAKAVRQRGSASPSPPSSTSHPQHSHYQPHSNYNNNGGNSRYGGRGRGGGPHSHHHHHNHQQHHNQHRNFRSDRDEQRSNHFLSAPVSSLIPGGTRPGVIHSDSNATAASSTNFHHHTSGDQQHQSNDHYHQYRSHPSFSYVDQPLLCGFVWKSSELAPKLDASIPPEDSRDEDDSNNKPDNDVNESAKQIGTGGDGETDPRFSKFYDEYRKRFCLNYVRSFFNVHWDDSWFRQRFSPLVKMVTVHQAEQARAFAEAQAFAAPFSSPDVTSIETFLNDVRLGNGIKQQQQPPTPGAVTSTSSSPRRNLSNVPAPIDVGSGIANIPPLQHLFSFQQKIPVIDNPNDSTAQNDVSNNQQKQQKKLEQFGLHVVDIPSHVTDEHIALAIVEQYNTTTLAKHEQKIADLQKSMSKTDAASSNSNDNTKDGKTATPTANLSVPKKGANKPTVSLPPPPLLKLNEIKVYTAPGTLVYDGPPSIVMHRQVLVTGPASALIEIIVTLKLRQDAATAASSLNEASTPGGAAASKRAVPRKGAHAEFTIHTHPEAFYGPFDLEVDCSDPYGRMEYDADGRGEAPADGQSVPQRRAIVGICPVYTYIPPVTESSASNVVDLATANLRKQQQQQSNQHHGHIASSQQHPFATQVVVLSAALSSKTRIEQDLLSAKTIAKALDTKKRIPRQFRLQNILSDQQIEEASPEDQLDVSIAYLRRVHLLSYYTGCAESAETIGDVLALKHPSGTIHLRLQNADEYIQNAVSANTHNDKSNEELASEDLVVDGVTPSSPTESRDNDEIKKDLLVQRLDDSIAKALESLQTWLGDDYEDDIDENTVPGFIDLRTERDSKEIEALEQHVQSKWVDDHYIDDDKRARCGFRFCHKLFKDKSFLEKHLLKKHSEFLRAEQAKCHDRYMMSEWDACTSRPVPPILVDCGTRFGCVSARIISGQTEPDVIDPEPELWNLHQEQQRRELEMKQKREELRQQQYNNNTFHHKDRSAVSESPRHQHDPNKPRNNRSFVDVDDMKEEKVEMSFDAIETDASALLAAANKKKKKKKKLL